VCNSDDPQSAAQMGICRTPPINEYMELRIFCQDWESVLIETWVLQIILSEINDVPTTVEIGFYEAPANFYDPQGRFEYAYQTQLDVFHSTYREAMERGRQLGDCRLASRTQNKYEECAHMVPEICSSEEPAVVQELVYSDVFDAPKGLGALGMESWFIPKFTAGRDPTLVSYLGMQGEDNRWKLAEMFNRPITWQKYCSLISTNGCNSTDDDGVAKRAPRTEAEGARYFVEGIYTGFFLATEENDCERDNGTTCTGHISDYPCSWPSYVWEQTQYLNISLESNGPQPGNGGYSLAQMEDIWRAANATKSDVIMQWWTPQALHQQFLGTDAEFIKVNLPTPTEECLHAREELTDRCAADYRTNSANFLKGSCDTLTASLYKMKIATLYDLTNANSIPAALQSPGDKVFELFRISEYQLAEIFTRWKEMGDPRVAICEWANENLDYMQSFVPNSYPRTMVEAKDGGGLRYTAAALAGFVILSAIASAFLVFQRRKLRIFVLAQVEFVGLLLSGTLFISTAALAMVLSTSNAGCVAVEWIINVGYTLELVPLLVKVSAITRLAMAAQKMKRFQVSRRALFGAVMGITALILVFMALWTGLDPPRQQHEYILSGEKNGEGETIVKVYEFCKSDSNAWYFVSVGWMAILLLSATVLAFQMRRVRMAHLRESGTLAALVYSHAVFVFIRLVAYLLGAVVRESILTPVRSLIFSFDALSTVLIYIMPKFLDGQKRSSSRILGIFTSTQNNHAHSSNPLASSTYASRAIDAINRIEESKEELKEDGSSEVQTLNALLAEKEREIKYYKQYLGRLRERSCASSDG